MIGKIILIILAATLLGMVTYLYFGPITNIANHPIIENIKQNWMTYAPLIGGGFTLGLPLLNAAYKKMKASAETKIEDAKVLVTQKSGELTEVQQKYSLLEAKYNKLVNEDSSQALVEAQTLVSQYQQQIRDMQNRHLGEISSLQARLDKYEPKEVIRVE